ncbi:TetR family transcriptional regulator [Amycolatopsis sp. NPDC003861]
MEKKGVRERVREAVQAELAQAAIELFAQRGFAETTVEAIAARAGVSERTFFRHFGAKEDPVLQPIERLSAAAAARLAGRLAEEPPVPALRAALGVAVEFVERDPSAMRTILQLNAANPGLRGRHLEKQAEWVDGLAAVMATRLGMPLGAPAARLPCAVVMAAYEKALTLCAAEDRLADVAEEFDAALAEVGALFEA